MRWGKFLDRNLAGEWADVSLPYSHLKNVAKQSLLPRGLRQDKRDYCEEFRTSLHKAVNCVDMFFTKRLAELFLRLEELEQRLDQGCDELEDVEDVQQKITALEQQANSLKLFAEYNWVSVRKLWVKLKRRGCGAWLDECFEAINRRAYRSRKSKSLVELVEGVVQLQSCLKERSVQMSAQDVQSRTSRIYRFFLWSCLALSVLYFWTPSFYSLSWWDVPVHLLIVYILYLVLINPIFNRRGCSLGHNRPGAANAVAVSSYLEYLPTNFLSKIWGSMHKVKLPVWTRVPLYRLWSVVTNCNLQEMRYPLKSYANLGDFFSRPLKTGARAIGEGLVSPVDGRIISCGMVQQGDRLESVKGLSYSLSQFLGLQAEEHTLHKEGSSSEAVPPFDATSLLISEQGVKQGHRLFQIILYLAPGDYHRIHSPTDWTVQSRRHFPGALLPVNPVFVRMVSNLFAVNERVAVSGQWDKGFFSLTAVGAYNVGSIALGFDREVETNSSWLQAGRERAHPYGPGTSYHRVYPGGIHLEKGEDMAHFKLGSTVVLVFEAPGSFQFTVERGQKMSVGQTIGHC